MESDSDTSIVFVRTPSCASSTTSNSYVFVPTANDSNVTGSDTEWCDDAAIATRAAAATAAATTTPMLWSRVVRHSTIRAAKHQLQHRQSPMSATPPSRKQPSLAHTRTPAKGTPSPKGSPQQYLEQQDLAEKPSRNERTLTQTYTDEGTKQHHMLPTEDFCDEDQIGSQRPHHAAPYSRDVRVIAKSKLHIFAPHDGHTGRVIDAKHSNRPGKLTEIVLNYSKQATPLRAGAAATDSSCILPKTALDAAFPDMDDHRIISRYHRARDDITCAVSLSKANEWQSVLDVLAEHAVQQHTTAAKGHEAITCTGSTMWGEVDRIERTDYTLPVTGELVLRGDNARAMLSHQRKRMKRIADGWVFRGKKCHPHKIYSISRAPLVHPSNVSFFEVYGELKYATVTGSVVTSGEATKSAQSMASVAGGRGSRKSATQRATIERLKGQIRVTALPGDQECLAQQRNSSNTTRRNAGTKYKKGGPRRVAYECDKEALPMFSVEQVSEQRCSRGMTGGKHVSTYYRKFISKGIPFSEACPLQSPMEHSKVRPFRYVEVDLKRDRRITHLSTMGRHHVLQTFPRDRAERLKYDLERDGMDDFFVVYTTSVAKHWVTKYKVSAREASGRGWRNLGTFTGNSDRITEVVHRLFEPVTARYVRFEALGYVGSMSMQVSVWGEVEVKEEDESLFAAAEARGDGARGARALGSTDQAFVTYSVYHPSSKKYRREGVFRGHKWRDWRAPDRRQLKTAARATIKGSRTLLD